MIVRHCRAADREHARRRRAYAHTFHRAGVICVARVFFALPTEHQRGILAHELGHMMLANRARHTERDADLAASAYLGVRVRYRNTVWGNRLQWAR